MNYDPAKVGEVIRKAREAKGLNQQELAERVGTTQPTIVRIEHGGVKWSRYLAPIERELGIPAADVLRGVRADTDPKPSEHMRVEVLIFPMHGETDPPPIAITIKNGSRTIVRVELTPEDFALAITGRPVHGLVTRGG